MKHQELIPHLFRTEFRKITAVLCKHMGIDHIAAAEDVASETFVAALETWPYKGIPENPTAWLYVVAKNKAGNYMSRNHFFIEKIATQPKFSSSIIQEPEIDWSDKNSTDSQLQMLFVICHPSISKKAQIGLALRILCGFGIDEIATAFLSNKETINKRLFRAKETLRLKKVQIEFPSEAEINNRLETVLTTLYLLFNEGYYSESNNQIIRKELCVEAMRLIYLLIENKHTNTPAVNALFALMCFHASRFDARKDENAELILYADQEAQWNKALIEKGVYYFNQAACGNKISNYHLEAGVAYWNTIKTDTKEKWETILNLYNQLLLINYSPVAALNRIFALSKVYGNQEAINAAEKLQITGNQYYYALLGELYHGIDMEESKSYFQKALAIAKTQAEKNTILKKLRTFPE